MAYNVTKLMKSNNLHRNESMIEDPIRSLTLGETSYYKYTKGL